jgi:pimeloyl-ACP methyl ester carboxylesterase
VKIETNGVTLDIAVEGEGRPVVLVHGFPDTKRLWSKVVPTLRDAGFQVIVPDMRGYGASSKPEAVDAYSIPMLAIDLVGVLDHLGHERAHVVGHDWGAVAAWGTAAFAPDRVDHLVTMSVGHPTAFATAGLPQREKSWYMLLFQYAGLAETWFTADGWANGREWMRHPDADAVIADLERDGSLTPGFNYYRATVTPEALTGPPLELPPITAPTMGIWSSGDPHLLEPQMQNSAKYVNDFRYERIDGAGHWMQWEAPDKVSALLVDFLPR